MKHIIYIITMLITIALLAGTIVLVKSIADNTFSILLGMLLVISIYVIIGELYNNFLKDTDRIKQDKDIADFKTSIKHKFDTANRYTIDSKICIKGTKEGSDVIKFLESLGGKNPCYVGSGIGYYWIHNGKIHYDCEIPPTYTEIKI